MKINELRKNIANDVLPAYFIVGEDEYLREFAYNIFAGLLNPDTIDFNLNIFQDFTNLYDIIFALRGYPLMDNRKLVVVKNPQPLDKEQESVLTDYLKKPELQSILLILDNGNVKALRKYGEIIDCSTLSPEECAKQIELTLKRQNREIERTAAIKLTEYCLSDLQKIHMEIKKLVCYKENGIITVKDVEAVVSPGTDYKIYEFTQSLAEKNTLKATAIMDSLLSVGNKPLSLLQAILTQYKRMLYSLISKGTDAEIAKCLNIKPYAVKMARKTAESYSPKILKQYCDSIVDLEYKSLTGQINKDDALKSCISLLLVK